MTSSEKIKLYVDYYNMAKDWRDSMLKHAFCVISDVFCESARIKRLVICDILYARGVIAPEDFVPYCKTLGIDKVINYGI